jgi:hypothetical protein
MGTPAEIDRTAPVIAHQEIDFDGSAATVWRIHIAVDPWPTRHPGVTAAGLSGLFE